MSIAILTTRKKKFHNLYFVDYCGIILIRGGQCSWIVKIMLIHGDIIWRVTSFVAFQCKIIHYFVENPWEFKFTYIDLPRNNDDSTVHCYIDVLP